MSVFASAFGAAVNAIFRDANVAEDGLWRAGGLGGGAPARIVRKRPDEVVGFGHGRAVMTTVMIDVRVSDVAQPASGDTVEIDGDVFDIIGAPIRDSLGLIWTCEASARN